MTTLLENMQVGIFFCPECGGRVDLCKCEKYRDAGCWDCGSDCEVNNRRKLKKALQEYLEKGNTLPVKKGGLDDLFEKTDFPSPCCGFLLKKIILNVRVSPRLADKNIFYICPLCRTAYNHL